MNYQELYQRYKTIRWVKHSLMPEWGVRARFQEVYHAALDDLHREIFPRRKKINWDNLPEDRVAELADYYVKQAMAWYTCAVGRACWLEHKLSTMAQDITGRIQDHGEERLLYTSDSSTYSQGFGTHKYTHAAAVDWANALVKAGHKIRIEQVDRSKDRWGCWSGEVGVWGYLDE